MDGGLDLRDPIFGFAALAGIAMVIATASIVLSKIKTDTETKAVRRFLNKFAPAKEEADYGELLVSYPKSYEILTKLSGVYVDNGDLEGALKINLAILEHLTHFEKEKKAAVLSSMGDIYTKGGFLQRSVEAYEKSLFLAPRNQKTLDSLVFLYEKRGELEKALDGLDALEELGVNVSAKKEFISLAAKLSKAVTERQKLDTLEGYGGNIPYFKRERLRLAIILDKIAAEKFLEESFDDSLLDVVWQADLKGFEKVSNPMFKAVLDGKKLISYEGKSGVLELDAFRALKKTDYGEDAALVFEYSCQKCSYVDIDYFFICKNCHAENSCRPKTILSKNPFGGEFSLESW